MIDFTHYVENVHFKAKGRSEPAVDCWGLVYLIYKKHFNIELPKFDYAYEEVSNKYKEVIHSLVEIGKDEFKEVNKGTLGDVLVLRIEGLPWHVGLALDSKRMIHCTKSVGCTIERYDSIRWERRISGIWRHKDRC